MSNISNQGYPKYKIGQWIDTNEESMNKEQATIIYGVQIKPEKGAKWMHCFRDEKPLLFSTIDLASAAITELKGGAA
jgi:hypothetical protein